MTDKLMMEEDEEMSDTEAELVEELDALEEELESVMTEIASLKLKIAQLEEEKEMEGWEEWGEMAGHNLTREDLQSVIGQAHVSEDALVAMFRKGVTVGIELMQRHVERHIDDAWKPYADKITDGEEADV